MHNTRLWLFVVAEHTSRRQSKPPIGVMLRTGQPGQHLYTHRTCKDTSVEVSIQVLCHLPAHFAFVQRLLQYVFLGNRWFHIKQTIPIFLGVVFSGHPPHTSSLGVQFLKTFTFSQYLARFTYLTKHSAIINAVLHNSWQSI